MPRNYNEPSRTDRILKKYDDLQGKLFHEKFHLNHQNQSESNSPIRGGGMVLNADRLNSSEDEYGLNLVDSYEFNDPQTILRLKWLDNSPRMSRLREHRQKRLESRLEVN
jgi:hypothetical protein